MTTTTTTTTAGHDLAVRWFRQLARPAEPRARLVCFPHAGGTPGTFQAWRPLLPPDVQVLAVRYPGRQDRLAEPPFTAMEPLADAVTAALEVLADDVPLALFGHSMGASVAHEVTRRLRVAPRLLMVSGRRPPHLLRPRDVYLRDDDALVADVRRLGEAAAAVLDDPDLRELVLPAIRADYTVVGTYRPGPVPPVAVPIVAYSGTEDADAPPEDMARWSELSSAGFARRTFPGGHFFLQQAPGELVRDVGERLAGLSAAA